MKTTTVAILILIANLWSLTTNTPLRNLFDSAGTGGNVATQQQDPPEDGGGVIILPPPR